MLCSNLEGVGAGGPLSDLCGEGGGARRGETGGWAGDRFWTYFKPSARITAGHMKGAKRCHGDCGCHRASSLVHLFQGTDLSPEPGISVEPQPRPSLDQIGRLAHALTPHRTQQACR